MPRPSLQWGETPRDPSRKRASPRSRVERFLQRRLAEREAEERTVAPTDTTSSPNESPQLGLDLRIANETRRMFGQHAQLHAFFDLVREGLDRGSLQATRLAFTRFRDAIEAHMDVEDKSYFPALRGLRPHLAPQLAQLVLDHAANREDLEELHELLARGSAEEFIRRFADFCDTFAQHEAREEALGAPTNGDN